MRDLGAADYVEKPDDPAELLRVVHGVLGGSGEGTPAADPPSGVLPGLAFRLSGWVYDEPAADIPRQIVAVCLIATLLSAAFWLVIG